MQGRAESRPVAVSLVAVPETSAAVLYSLHEVFASVGTTWSQFTGEPATARRMQPRVIAERGAPFHCATGAPIAPDARFAETADSDAVIVADLALGPDDDPRGRWPAAAAWLRRQFESGATVCSVCTGSVLLAEAGLLDGLEATTHWGARRLFATVYPSVKLRPERILTAADAEGRIVTSGGSASWSELALHLVARFCGHEEAVRTAKLSLLGDRSDGQLPFAAMLRPQRHGDAAIAQCQEWIADHYAARNPVTRMIARSGLTTRTFKRRFRATTGYTPIEYVQTLRIEEAKQLLETTDAPTDAVGETVGYEDPASFRRIFKRMTGITPARYRRRFRGIAEFDG